MKTSIGIHTTEVVPPMSASDLESHLTETWTRDAQDADLWHGPHGVIVNSAALEMRQAFYTIVRKEA